jgi:hypothetical protein
VKLQSRGSIVLYYKSFCITQVLARLLDVLVVALTNYHLAVTVPNLWVDLFAYWIVAISLLSIPFHLILLTCLGLEHVSLQLLQLIVLVLFRFYSLICH